MILAYLHKKKIIFLFTFFMTLTSLFSLAPFSSRLDNDYPEELLIQMKKLQNSKAKFSILETDDGYLVVNHKGMALIGFYGKGEYAHPNVIDQGRGNYPSFSQRLSIEKESGSLRVQMPEGNYEYVSYFNPDTQSHKDVKFDTLDNETEHEYIFRHGPLRMLEAKDVKLSANRISGRIDLSKTDFPGMPAFYKNFSFVFSYILDAGTVHMDVEVTNNGDKDICFPGYLYHNTINTALPDIDPHDILIKAPLESEWPKNPQTLIVEGKAVPLNTKEAQITKGALISEFLPEEGNGGLDKIYVLQKDKNSAYVKLGDYSLEITFRQNLPYLAIWAIVEDGMVKLAMEGTDAPAGGISLNKDVFSAPVLRRKESRKYRLSLKVTDTRSDNSSVPTNLKIAA